MLMMRVTCLMHANQPSADAHDACPCAGIQGGCRHLMLMMQATCFVLANQPSTDAHDAGFCRYPGRVSAPDADDAGHLLRACKPAVN